MKSALTLLLFTFCILIGSAQDIDLGKIKPYEFEISYQHLDSNANAVIIYDEGSRHVQLNSMGIQVLFDRTMRIKILNKEGLHWADFELWTESKGGGGIQKVEAYTHNLIDGKVKTEKFSRRDIFSTRESDHYNKHTFSLPNVREGSIIDVHYRTRSEEIYHLPNYYFQHSIPTLYTTYTIQYPEYLYYHKLSRGYENVVLKESNVSTEMVVFSNNTQSIPVKVFTFEGRDIKPFIEEPYMLSRENYISSISFELKSVALPNQPVDDFTTSWESLNKLYLEDENFGKWVGRYSPLKSVAAAIAQNANTEEDKIQSAYQWVKSELTCNDKGGIAARQTVRQLMNEKTGSGAELNLLLVGLLELLDIEAYPIILSTRQHGYIYKGQPRADQFNYTIGAVALENDSYLLLDVSDPNLNIQELPIKCYNGDGWLVRKDNPGWLPIKPNSEYKKLVSFNLAVSDDHLIGEVIEHAEGYEAQRKKAALKEHTDFEAYSQAWRDDHSGLEINDFSMEGIAPESTKVKSKYGMKCSKYIESVDGFVLITPLLHEQTKKNPFSLEKREYPVDFAVPISETIATKIAIPSGYSVESLPENEIVSLGPDVQFIYNISSINAEFLQITSRLQIKKTLFTAEEYPFLKEFFDKIVIKHAEPIILAKHP